MHRFYLPPEKVGQVSSPSISGGLDRQDACPTLQLAGREAHHASHVLRLKHGDEIVVLDGVGHELICEIENASCDTISLRVVKRNLVLTPPCSITLLVAIPKGKIIESIIQKSVELGTRRIVPLLTERVITRLDERDREHKRGQWQQIAVEAIKQCGAAWLPKIETPMEIAKFLARKEEFNLSLVGSLQTERRHPREIISSFEKANGRLPKSAAVWIGPEGDFTLDELKMIQNSGALPITLGNLILRVETAAIYCLSFLNYELTGNKKKV